MAVKQTPMMDQYRHIKEEHPNELVFFRLGDFYELFYDDALVASKELNLTLTGRGGHKEEGRAPMCGVPHHAAESYIETLIKKGYKVAICEQLEDPKLVKGLVKRDVIRVITPGTVMTENGTNAKENNFLGMLYQSNDDMVLIFCDITTGEVVWDLVSGTDRDSSICNILSMYRPSELVLCGSLVLPALVKDYIDQQLGQTVESPYRVESESSQDLQALALAQFGDTSLMEESVLEGLGYLVSYFTHVIKMDISHLNYIHRLSVGDRMVLDASALHHLEVTRNLRDGSSKGTVLSVLDRTRTPMGARLLKQWLESPLMNVAHINRRQMAVEELVSQPVLRKQLQDRLDMIFDFERILSRVETGSVSPRDFTSLRESLRELPGIKSLGTQLSSQALVSAMNAMKTHEDICTLLTKAIAEQPALTLKEGHVINDGYNEGLDTLRSLATNSQKWLQELENDVREKTGIRLKTGYNKVFGYYFEVTKATAANVPEYFIRKQTLANAERYITPELKEFEIKILNAKDKMIALEHQLYQEVRENVCQAVKSIQKTARQLAVIDVLASFAEVAYEKHYIRPTMTMNGQIHIKDGRHPIIENYLKQELFVPNDADLNHSDQEFLLITGPNMAGKSTYMRQVAVLMIMAQVGVFIPAVEATISPVDRIFTRVGASDDISTGQSTFMVEMKEVAYILSHATKNSLLILDEIGRGTSTFDGLSIAQAVVEYICKHLHSKTLFATHYHELIPLEDVYPKLKNFTVAVKEKGRDVVFLRRIIRGGADRSYGIHVARLAGLPESVLKRADVILAKLEADDTFEISQSKLTNKQVSPSDIESARGQEVSVNSANLFTSSVVDQLLAIDVMSMTPIEALSALYKLQEEARKGGGQ